MANLEITREQIALGLRDLGLEDGASVLVHSSLRSFGYVTGGASAVIDALRDAVGPSGHVIVPTLTGTRHDGPEQPPIFNVRNTPCWTGRIPSTMLALPDAKRSLHPTHSVAGLGPSILELEAGHEDCVTPCGPGSAYVRLADRGGYILLIGVGQESNTTIHTAEELSEVSYHMQDRLTDTIVIDYNGVRQVKRLGLHDWGTPRDFTRIDDPLRQLGIMRVGKIGQSTVRLIRAMPMLDWLVDVLRRDERYLCKD